YTSEERAPATVIVTHHIEEIPAGTTHALLLKEGQALYTGAISETLTERNIEEVFGVRVSLSFDGLRYFAAAKN
ncbi:MAG: ABC transporter ATP-binding protein, partial [Actinomycetota bacterium]